MVKILSQAGISLADVYDVEGSIAGIEQLRSEEVQLVHEMGATIFSERVSGAIRRATTGDINQSTTWDIVLTDLPAGVSRILGVSVFADVGSRVNDAAVSLRDPTGGREIPVFLWDSTQGVLVVARMRDDGAAAATFNVLASTLNIGAVPSMLIGEGQPQRVNEIAFRGGTNAFGAGTVEVIMLVYLALAQVGGISSRGLPVPGW